MFADIIDATDDETVVEHNMHVRHPDNLAQGYWGQGRVTLAGDAAHPLRPASGMLTTQAGRTPFRVKAFLAHSCLPTLLLATHNHVAHTLTLIRNPLSTQLIHSLPYSPAGSFTGLLSNISCNHQHLEVGIHTGVGARSALLQICCAVMCLRSAETITAWYRARSEPGSGGCCGVGSGNTAGWPHTGKPQGI